jgi:hypothetical protein
VSSANSVAINRSVSRGILKPLREDWRSASARGSIARLNSRYDRGSPCLTPRVTLKGDVLLAPLQLVKKQ